MRARWIAAFALVVALCGAFSPRNARAAAPLDQALRERIAAAAPTDLVEVVVNFEAAPDAAVVNQLLALGLEVTPFQRLPMAGAIGLPAQIEALATLPGVKSVYLNRRLELFLRESVSVIGADVAAQKYGYSGNGVGVAIVDTGVDATRPDLAYGSVTKQNVKLLGLQAAAGQYVAPNAPVYALENQQNTDTTSGHGTHVAGIVAASGAASNGYYRGVAPGADIIGLGTGELIDIYTALAAFEYVLENQQRYNIKVVNCSWGDIVPGFDENDPVNVATKELYNAGIVVVFSSGNSGANTNSLNTYSVAPWVIGVAAGEKDGKNVSFFSSRGIPGDDFYHPTITAPGSAIVSTRAVSGFYVNGGSAASDLLYVKPDYITGYTAASGTSMAAPHVAGAVALMYEARPTLTPELVKRFLEITATKLEGYQEYAAGAGYLNALGAVEVARSFKNLRTYINPRTYLSEQVFDVVEQWNGSVAASTLGRSASDTKLIEVDAGTRSLEVIVEWDLVASDLNLYLYGPDGKLVGKSEVIQSVYNHTNETVHLADPAPGTYRVEVRGFLNAPQAYNGTASHVVAVTP